MFANQPKTQTNLDPTTLSKLPPDQQRARQREWNRGPISDLFPRIPRQALEPILDLCIDKGFTYDLSQSKFYNARRYTSIIVAHVRHQYSDYDRLLREVGLARYDARAATSEAVWKVMRLWCPWDESNEVLRRCFHATLVRPEHRGNAWDPMDIDEDSDDEGGDPMDLD